MMDGKADKGVWFTPWGGAGKTDTTVQPVIFL